MSNRCQSCEKFVSLENGEPEIQSLEVEWCDDHFVLSLDLRAMRNCAECGDEMKEYNTSIEAELFLDQFEPHLLAEDLSKVQGLLDEGKLEFDWEEGDTSMDESAQRDGDHMRYQVPGGGGRYKKSVITMMAEATVKFSYEGKRYTASSGLMDEAPASAFEDLY